MCVLNRHKYETEGLTEVYIDPNTSTPYTLLLLFKTLGLNAAASSVDHLGTHALNACFQRFDLFNEKYNPYGEKGIREVFLKTDNHIKGIVYVLYIDYVLNKL